MPEPAAATLLVAGAIILVAVGRSRSRRTPRSAIRLPGVRALWHSACADFLAQKLSLVPFVAWFTVIHERNFFPQEAALSKFIRTTLPCLLVIDLAGNALPSWRSMRILITEPSSRGAAISTPSILWGETIFTEAAGGGGSISKAPASRARTPRFRSAATSLATARRACMSLKNTRWCDSYDNQDWFFFDNNNLGPVNYTFSNAAPFTQNEVYVAYAIPYSHARSAAHAQSVLASPWAAPTVSGNSNGVIGQSPTGTDDLGRSVPAASTCLPIALPTRPPIHPPLPSERSSSPAACMRAKRSARTPTKGWLTGSSRDDPRCPTPRHRGRVRLPRAQPIGPLRGHESQHHAANPQPRSQRPVGPEPLERRCSFGCGNNSCQDIRESGEAMLADVAATPGGVDAFVDFHSTVPDYTIDPSGRPDDFGYVANEDWNADWWLELRDLQPNIFAYPSGSGDFTTAGYARRRLGADVEITFETQFTVGAQHRLLP